MGREEGMNKWGQLVVQQLLFMSFLAWTGLYILPFCNSRLVCARVHEKMNEKP
jgi:hypothetical protein